MKRIDAIRTTVNVIPPESIIVSANGFISRELFSLHKSKRDFYMIGSMGLASSIGLGVALAKPKRCIVVLDGDGNLLMNLGSMATIAMRNPSNFLHVVLDNRTYESTGGQPTAAQAFDFCGLAKTVGYKSVDCVHSKQELEDSLSRAVQRSELSFIHANVETGNADVPRVGVSPPEMAREFRSEVAGNLRGKDEIQR